MGRRPGRVSATGPCVVGKHLLSFAFMVEELLRWLVAGLHGMHALARLRQLSVNCVDFHFFPRPK